MLRIIGGLIAVTGLCLAAPAMAQSSQPQDERTPLTYGQPDAAFMDKANSVTPASTLVICAGQPIPQGWVIVARTTNFQCSSSLDNAYVIKQPGPSEVVCAYSPIPANYVVTGTTTNFQCSNSLHNAKIIRRV